MLPTEPRYCGTFTVDGVERYYNVEADSREDAENRLINLHPGKAIAVVDARSVGGMEL